MRILLSLLIASTAFAADGFVESPDHRENPDIPHGTVTKMPPWKSNLYADTTRDWSVYVPAQYKAEQPAALMIFQDGHDYVNVKGNWRVPIVFDNLIARGDMPPTIAVFINPGHEISKDTPKSPWQSSNRSREYDTLGDLYSKFLIEEILPEVGKQWKITTDPELRAICGASSGGICAFTVAWERPDSFRKVLSTIGSFTDIRGGYVYPALIRKTDKKPIRVYLEDASGDLDNKFGNWPLANQQMYRSLLFMKYDVRFDYAEGYSHSSNHGGSIFPEALKWLWREWKK